MKKFDGFLLVSDIDGTLAEQRYINLKGMVAKYEGFHQIVSKNTAFVDVGAGSVQVSLFYFI